MIRFQVQANGQISVLPVISNPEFYSKSNYKKRKKVFYSRIELLIINSCLLAKLLSTDEPILSPALIVVHDPHLPVHSIQHPLEFDAVFCAATVVGLSVVAGEPGADGLEPLPARLPDEGAVRRRNEPHARRPKIGGRRELRESDKVVDDVKLGLSVDGGQLGAHRLAGDEGQLSLDLWRENSNLGGRGGQGKGTDKAGAKRRGRRTLAEVDTKYRYLELSPMKNDPEEVHGVQAPSADP